MYNCVLAYWCHFSSVAVQLTSPPNLRPIYPTIMCQQHSITSALVPHPTPSDKLVTLESLIDLSAS
jgi:hypothetical protein